MPQSKRGAGSQQARTSVRWCLRLRERSSGAWILRAPWLGQSRGLAWPRRGGSGSPTAMLQLQKRNHPQRTHPAVRGANAVCFVAGDRSCVWGRWGVKEGQKMDVCRTRE